MKVGWRTRHKEVWYIRLEMTMHACSTYHRLLGMDRNATYKGDLEVKVHGEAK